MPYSSKAKETVLVVFNRIGLPLFAKVARLVDLLDPEDELLRLKVNRLNREPLKDSGLRLPSTEQVKVKTAHSYPSKWVFLGQSVPPTARPPANGYPLVSS